MPAKFVTIHGTQSTVLLDVSLTGARVKANGEMRAGQSIVLNLREVETFGVIVWVNQRECGIDFDKPITKEHLLLIRERDQNEQLPSDDEIERRRLREWAQGERRV